jgi:MFS transporter, DHA2 family, multidrug resistance protein
MVSFVAGALLRGLGLGCLFLPITLIAFGKVNNRALASGISRFNTGRQLGSLRGVAGPRPWSDNNVVANVAVLGDTAGVPAVSERLTTTAMFAAKGMDVVAATGRSVLTFALSTPQRQSGWVRRSINSLPDVGNSPT